MILRQIILSRALSQLVVIGMSADEVVAFHEDGPAVDDALDILRGLSESPDEALSLDAQDYLRALLEARARRRR